MRMRRWLLVVVENDTAGFFGGEGFGFPLQINAEGGLALMLLISSTFPFVRWCQRLFVIIPIAVDIKETAERWCFKMFHRK